MPLRLGPLLFCICVALYRAVWLSVQLSGFHVAEAGYLLLADLPVVGVLGLLAFAEGKLPRAWKWAPLLLTVVLVAAYLMDVTAVLVLNARLQLADLRRFAVEWWLIPSFLSMSSLALLVATVACCFVRLSIPRSVARSLPATALVLALLPFAIGDQSIPSHLQTYTGSILLLGKEIWGSRRQPLSRYRSGDFAAYGAEYDALFHAPIAASGKNIVLIMVESLSAVDSRRTSGIRNLLPRFDDLSREGMLFRNFFANFEASEGGIVSLVSGVPPLHFPTASTDTFGEYALQRSITGTLKRNGYRCEFLTNVPLRFISMDAYTQSPTVGFSFAAGQQEIARFTDAPRFAFQSPGDHLLYEEVLARLALEGGARRQPVFLAAVTASSHHPYVDPRGRGDTEENAWAYVQDELWWLYEELTKRGFFDNGLLLITGDHRKMAPVQEKERAQFGESAKARIPLVIIGKGVPKDVIDDRLFQQADLLRMLDRATHPGTDLSSFALWVERYVFVYGVASNASNVQVFQSGDLGRRGFRLNLRGAEIDWVTRPANARAVERSIHRQRALQQAVRTARLAQAVLNFGRDLEPSGSHGVLVGFSTDVDLSRDPDDPRGSLKTFTTDSFNLDSVLNRVGGGRDAPFTLTARAFLSIPSDGQYWFSAFADDESCLAIDRQIVLGCQHGLNEGLALLTAGVHRFDLRFVERGRTEFLHLKWLPPGAKAFTEFPQQTLILPAARD